MYVLLLFYERSCYLGIQVLPRDPARVYVSGTVEREAVADGGAGRYEVLPVDGDAAVQESHPPAVRAYGNDDVIQ